MKNITQMVAVLVTVFLLLVGTVHAVPIVWRVDADGNTEWFEMNLTRHFTTANSWHENRPAQQRSIAVTRHDRNVSNHLNFQFDSENTGHAFHHPDGKWEGRPDWLGNMPPVGNPHFPNADHGHQAPAPVPEPATVMLLGIGLVWVAGLGRRRQRS